MPYPEMVALAHRAVAELPAAEADAVFRRTALRLYFPNPKPVDRWSRQ